MAKVGEGDPRWLVKDREDGKNVNNWHWSEKDMFSWAKEKMYSLIKDQIAYEDDEMKILLTKIDKMKGTVTINVRKAKTLFIWDFNMTVLWSGEIKESGEKSTGKVECTDINVTDDEFNVYVRLDKDSPAGLKLRNELKQKAFPVIKSFVDIMTDELKTNFGDSMIIKENPEKTSVKKEEEVTKSVVTGEGEALEVSSFTTTVSFGVPSHVIYETLTDPGRVSGFTGGPAEISNSVGGSFSLLGGTVEGTQETLDHGKKIEQKWRFKSWPANHYSKVIMEMKDDEGNCVLTLTQKDVPNFDMERTKTGWESIFWSRISGVFGWSYKIIK